MGISSKRRQLSHRFFGPAMTRTASEVVGGAGVGLETVVHTLRTVRGRDVGEAALWPAGHSSCGFVARDASDERAQVLDELVVDGVCRDADRVVAVGDLSPEFEVPVPFYCLGDGVEVDHHLDGMAGAVVAGLGVDDDGVVFPSGDDVRSAGEGCGSAAEFKPVLSLDVDVVAADGPVGDAFVEQRGVVEHPLGLVEIGWDTFPTLVMCLEPDGPLAGVLAGE